MRAGGELPVPPDLRALVERAAGVLADRLQKVGKVFDIEARWRFVPSTSEEFAVRLSLTRAGRGALSYEFPKNALASDDAVSRKLWAPISLLTPVLSEEVDQEFERIWQRSQEPVTADG